MYVQIDQFNLKCVANILFLQMFEFTDEIISTMLKSKKDSRNWIDPESIKVLRTQIRALLQAIEVVVEQCYKRTQALEESWHQSIKRKKELDELESSDSPSPEPLEQKGVIYSNYVNH